MRKVPTIDVDSHDSFLMRMKNGEVTLSEQLLSSIEWGMKNKAKKVTVFHLNIIELQTKITFELPKEKWQTFLEQMMPKTINHEHYELSGRIKKMLERLDMSE